MIEIAWVMGEGVVALIAGSKINIPLTPVPFALSPVICFLLMGLVYTPGRLSASFLSWFSLGLRFAVLHIFSGLLVLWGQPFSSFK